ncbi:MAG: thiamine diphosphokinase [Actinomycetota bacterium]
MGRTAVVLSGGEPPGSSLASRFVGDHLVVAADAGLHHAEILGLRVDLVVGDLDSVDPVRLAAAEAAGAVVERHPVDKDATDLELALDAVCARAVERVTVVGAGGGRLDHLLANLAVLGHPRYAAITVEALLGDTRVAVVHGGTEVAVEGAPGALVTLLPAGGPARGVTTTGLRFPLRGEDLDPTATRGVSNVVAGAPATVSLGAGTLLVIEPEVLAR